MRGNYWLAILAFVCLVLVVLFSGGIYSIPDLFARIDFMGKAFKVACCTCFFFLIWQLVLWVAKKLSELIAVSCLVIICVVATYNFAWKQPASQTTTQIAQRAPTISRALYKLGASVDPAKIQPDTSLREDQNFAADQVSRLASSALSALRKPTSSKTN